MMPQLFDTHAHLDADIYAGELDIVVKHALEEGVWMVTVGNDYESSRRAVEIAERFPQGVYAAIGLHPLKVPADLEAEDKLLNLEKFYELARREKVVAVGETGLDFHDLPEGFRADPKVHQAEKMKANQRKVFGRFLDLSRELRLPLLLHCRDAHDEMIETLETWNKTTPGFDSRGILHCFTGSWKQARRYFNLDLCLSVTGIVSHGGYQTEVIRKSPASRLALESDCPYLTAVPWSARRNEPSYLPTVAAAVAGMRGEPVERLAEETTKNALRVLRKLRV